MREFAGAAELEIWYDVTRVDRLLDTFTEPEVRERVSRHIDKKARRRTSRGALEKLTEDVGDGPRITENPPFRVHLDAQEYAHAVEVFAGYRQTLAEHRRDLLDRFRLVDVVRQVVGVGSVGMRVYLVLLEGRGNDPLFLQLKQAEASVYEPFVGPSRHANHGQRVVVGKRLVQSATDIFVGWTSVGERHYYVRQFRDMKVIPDNERLAPLLVDFASACVPCWPERMPEPVIRSRSRRTSVRARLDRAMADYAISCGPERARPRGPGVGHRATPGGRRPGLVTRLGELSDGQDDRMPAYQAAVSGGSAPASPSGPLLTTTSPRPGRPSTEGPVFTTHTSEVSSPRPASTLGRRRQPAHVAVVQRGRAASDAQCPAVERQHRPGVAQLRLDGDRAPGRRWVQPGSGTVGTEAERWCRPRPRHGDRAPSRPLRFPPLRCQIGS